MKQTNYKSEIEQSRIGSLGSSDAKIVERIGRKGIDALTETDKQRLAVMTGQADRRDFHTDATDLGDVIEQRLFTSLQKQKPHAVSNPLHEDQAMSNFYGFRILNHIDIEVVDEDKVVWYEVKASADDTDKVKDTYKAQLQWHWMLLKKIYGKTGKELKLYLVHYKTRVTDTFSLSNITKVKIEDNLEIEDKFYQGFILLKDFLPTFTYNTPEERSIRLVEDEQVQTLRQQVERAVIEAARAQKKIDEFKKALKDYMERNGIKKIYSDEYSVTYTAPSSSTTFDSKALKEDNPELYAKYARETQRSSSVTIKINQ